MRFAGTRIEGLLGNDAPDYGALTSTADSLRSKESQAVTNLMGKTAATGISAAGKVKGEEIVGAAEQQMASAKSQAAMMGMFGKIAGAGIGAAGDAGLFGGGGTPTMKWDSSNSGLGYGSNLTVGDGIGFSDLPTGFTW